RLEILQGTGLLDELEDESSYTPSAAGRAMLRICAELLSCQLEESGEIASNAELSYILGLLEDEPPFRRPREQTIQVSERRDVLVRDVLFVQAKEAQRRWDIAWEAVRLPARLDSSS